MGRQSDAFLTGEGDAWYERNKSKSQPDPVLKVIADLSIKPKEAFEFGCGDGTRLKAIHDAYRTKCFGVDASRTAVDMANRKMPIRVWHGPAINAPIGSFDLVIYGFCLYVCDPEEIMMIVAAGDRILQSDGYLIIHDFLPDAPCKRKYIHKAGLHSYKMDYSKLWLANPRYSLAHREVLADGVGVTVLKKASVEDSFPYEQ